MAEDATKMAEIPEIIIADLEDEIKELEADIVKKDDAIEALEKKVRDQDDTISDLERENDDLRKETSDGTSTLEFYADPHNWTDDRLTPVIPHTFGDDPFGPAAAALEGKI